MTSLLEPDEMRRRIADSDKSVAARCYHGEFGSPDAEHMDDMKDLALDFVRAVAAEEIEWTKEGSCREVKDKMFAAIESARLLVQALDGEATT